MTKNFQSLEAKPQKKIWYKKFKFIKMAKDYCTVSISVKFNQALYIITIGGQNDDVCKAFCKQTKHLKYNEY